MRKYHIPLYDEYDENCEHQKGVLTVVAPNKYAADGQATAWLFRNPGYVVDMFAMTSEPVEAAEIGDVEL